MPSIMTTTGATLQPSGQGYSPAEFQLILDTEGQQIFMGLPEECEVFMQAEGLRPHCNCELITPDRAGAWLTDELGWA